MTTVYVLLHTVDYEGSSLRGVYASEEEAQTAWENWRSGIVSDDECDIREVEVGAPADWHW